MHDQLFETWAASVREFESLLSELRELNERREDLHTRIDAAKERRNDARRALETAIVEAR